MTTAHTLTRHRDIQAWVAARRGQPALVRRPTSFGEFRSRLALRFEHAGSAPTDIDQSASPVSWSAWLAELDRQQLALRVSEGDSAEYEFVERKTLN